jgi:uncharacterized coiled-coil DUF342 family protein
MPQRRWHPSEPDCLSDSLTLILAEFKTFRLQNQATLAELRSLRDSIRTEIKRLTLAAQRLKKQNVHNLARIMSLKQQVKELENALSN